MSEQPYKTCPGCKKVWRTQIELVEDHSLLVNGYQASFEDSHAGLFFLTHDVPGCGSTLALVVSDFRSFYAGPHYSELNRGRETCRELCLDRNRLEFCDAECSMHWVREVLQYLRRHEVPPHIPRGESGRLGSEAPP